MIEGMDVVDAIAATPVTFDDSPYTPQVMARVTAETFGVDYPEPKKF